MINVEHLDKTIGGQQILRDVTMDVDRAEVFALIGRSGSGKTVLMKHLIGLMQPDAGRVVIDGVDLTHGGTKELEAFRRDLGVLFQNGALFDYMTVFENTAFPLRMLTNDIEEVIEARVQECLDMVELPGAAGKMPAQLSGGEKKRAALARAIVLEPKYLFFDEPDSGLDPETSITIDKLISTLSKRMSVTSVVVTHSMHSVFLIADRVAFLHDRTLQFIGTVEEMRKCDDAELCAFMKATEYQV